MPNRRMHLKWATLLGLTTDTATYVANALDSKGSEDDLMPEDFRGHFHDKKLRGTKGSKVAVADFLRGPRDRDKRKIIQAEDLRWLTEHKGASYAKAYHLHRFLDHLDNPATRTWIKDALEAVEDSIDRYWEKRAAALGDQPEARRALHEVAEALKDHQEELIKDLKL